MIIIAYSTCSCCQPHLLLALVFSRCHRDAKAGEQAATTVIARLRRALSLGLFIGTVALIFLQVADDV